MEPTPREPVSHSSLSSLHPTDRIRLLGPERRLVHLPLDKRHQDDHAADDSGIPQSQLAMLVPSHQVHFDLYWTSAFSRLYPALMCSSIMLID